MRNYRRSAKYGAVLAAVLLLAGCSEEAGNAVQQETVQEEDAWEQGAEEDDEKGYGLPVVRGGAGAYKGVCPGCAGCGRSAGRG